MVNQQLSDYVNQQKALGVTDGELRRRLVDSGWVEADVNEVLAGKPVVKPEVKPSEVQLADLSMPGKFELGLGGQTAKRVEAAGLQNSHPAGSEDKQAKHGENGGKMHWVLVLVAVMILGLAGVIGYWWWQKSATVAPAAVKTVSEIPTPTPESTGESKLTGGGLNNGVYTDDVAGFLITPPTDWKVNNGGAFGTLVAFSNTVPDTDGTKQYVANMNVVVSDMGAQTLAEYVEQSKDLMAQNFANNKLVSERPAGGASDSGVFLESTFDQDGISVHSLQLIKSLGMKAYVVTGASMDNVWDKYGAVFETTEKSFQVK